MKPTNTRIYIYIYICMMTTLSLTAIAQTQETDGVTVDVDIDKEIEFFEEADMNVVNLRDELQQGRSLIDEVAEVVVEQDGNVQPLPHRSLMDEVVEVVVEQDGNVQPLPQRSLMDEVVEVVVEQDENVPRRLGVSVNGNDEVGVIVHEMRMRKWCDKVIGECCRDCEWRKAPGWYWLHEMPASTTYYALLYQCRFVAEIKDQYCHDCTDSCWDKMLDSIEIEDFHRVRGIVHVTGKKECFRDSACGCNKCCNGMKMGGGLFCVCPRNEPWCPTDAHACGECKGNDKPENGH